ncbi:hypothetical protein ULMS_03410 [Patiriisocius marinistellae]|uniref:Uncharacterized protein n=1 Tax=Patiriisocius marinistellae TaxID=2494560 RepID=A0A5J4FTF2_9FLAO|nr:hypothetical protein ULMS_03410 [Patiriisocius marinistellae]
MIILTIIETSISRKIKIGINIERLSAFDNTSDEKSNSLNTTQNTVILNTIDPKYKNPSWSCIFGIFNAIISKRTHKKRVNKA